MRGLKLYEDVFTENELSKLTDFVTELRVAGRNGELTGGPSFIRDAFIVKLVFLFGRSYEIVKDLFCRFA